MCLAFACDVGIANHSLSVYCCQEPFYCYCYFKEGVRIGFQKLFFMLGLIFLFDNLQMLANTRKAQYWCSYASKLAAEQWWSNYKEPHNLKLVRQ